MFDSFWWKSSEYSKSNTHQFTSLVEWYTLIKALIYHYFMHKSNAASETNKVRQILSRTVFAGCVNLDCGCESSLWDSRSEARLRKIFCKKELFFYNSDSWRVHLSSIVHFCCYKRKQPNSQIASFIIKSSKASRLYFLTNDDFASKQKGNMILQTHHIRTVTRRVKNNNCFKFIP